MKTVKQKSRALLYLLVVTLLLCRIFPAHLHTHNHFHEGPNEFVTSEVQFLLLEHNSSEEHEHAIVSDINSDYLIKVNLDSDLVVFMLLVILLLGLVFFRNRYSSAFYNYRFRQFFFRPILRAPPAQA